MPRPGRGSLSLAVFYYYYYYYLNKVWSYSNTFMTILGLVDLPTKY